MTTRLKWMAVAIGTAVVVSTLALWSLWMGPQPRVLIVGSTTTTQDTGLLEALLPAFEQRTGYQVKPIVQGSGAVLALAARGEADVLLTHSPEQEREWLAGGYGRERRLVMHNDFILVGPPD
ncbi:MAG TPA: substrate-binding domain-containing protein, partial [Thermoplasmata archaeon]